MTSGWKLACLRKGMSRGFTLIEVLLATTVLVSGLLAAAHLFSYSAHVRLISEQRNHGLRLAFAKIEELRTTPPGLLVEGGGLDPDHPVTGYADHAGFDPAGRITPAAAQASSYLRLWQVTGEWNRIVTVTVHAPGRTARERREVARLSAGAAPR